MAKHRSCAMSPWQRCTLCSPSWISAPWAVPRASLANTCGTSSPWTHSIVTWHVTQLSGNSPTRCPPGTGKPGLGAGQETLDVHKPSTNTPIPGLSQEAWGGGEREGAWQILRGRQGLTSGLRRYLTHPEFQIFLFVPGDGHPRFEP